MATIVTPLTTTLRLEEDKNWGVTLRAGQLHVAFAVAENQVREALGQPKTWAARAETADPCSAVSAGAT